MTQNQEQFHGYAFRFPATPAGENLVKVLRSNLNNKSFNLSKRYSGKRPVGTSQGSTLKENADSIRVYVNETDGYKNASPVPLSVRNYEQMQTEVAHGQIHDLLVENKAQALKIELQALQLSLYNEVLQHSGKYAGIYQIVQRIAKLGRGKAKSLDAVEKEILDMAEKGEIDLD